MIGWLMVGLCCGGVGVAVARSSKGVAPQGTDALAAAPVPDGELPWFPMAVETTIWSGLQRGIVDPHALAVYVVERVYPVSPDGRPVSWPPAPGAPSTYHRAFQRVKIRANRHLAIAADEAAGR